MVSTLRTYAPCVSINYFQVSLPAWPCFICKCKRSFEGSMGPFENLITEVKRATQAFSVQLCNREDDRESEYYFKHNDGTHIQGIGLGTFAVWHWLVDHSISDTDQECRLSVAGLTSFEEPLTLLMTCDFSRRKAIANGQFSTRLMWATGT